MKALGGGGGSFSRTSKKHVAAPAPKKSGPKKMSHKELIALWTRQGGKFAAPTKVWTKADIDRAKTEKEKRLAEQAAAAEMAVANGGAGLIVEDDDDEVNFRIQANELARARMEDLAQKLSASGKVDCVGDRSPEELKDITDCRRSQIEELEMLEAMYVDEYLLLSDSAGVDELRANLEAVGDVGADPTEQELEGLRSVAAHPPFEFVLQITVEDQRPAEETQGKQLVASMLMRVRFPLLYPTPGTPPELQFADIMITDALEEFTPEKVLWSLVDLDEEGLIEAMLQQAEENQPGPCVYAMVDWLQQNAFLHPAK